MVVILAIAFAPIATALVMLGVSGVDETLEDAARTVARPLFVLTRISIPAAQPAVVLAAIIIFALSLSELGVPMFLRVDVYSAAVFARLGGIDRSPGEALWLAAPLLPLALALLFLERKFAGARSFAVLHLSGTRRDPLPFSGRGARAAALVFAWSIAALSALPLIALALFAMRGGFSALPQWIERAPLTSLLTSLAARAMTAQLELEGAVLTRGDRAVLSGASISIEKGETLALIGPSGSGKTTVLRALLGFVVPERGVLRIDGRVAARDGKNLIPPEERNLAVVFQDLALWPHLTVYENLAFGLRARGRPKNELGDRIGETLRRLELTGKERRHPGELSGGERQRVAIGRALVLDPAAILLDEPLSNLDVVLKRELISLFRTLFDERGTTALYVTHDVREAFAIARRLAVIEHGAITMLGTLAEARARGASAGDFVRRTLELAD